MVSFLWLVKANYCLKNQEDNMDLRDAQIGEEYIIKEIVKSV